MSVIGICLLVCSWAQ